MNHMVEEDGSPASKNQIIWLKEMTQPVEEIESFVCLKQMNRLVEENENLQEHIKMFELFLRFAKPFYLCWRCLEIFPNKALAAEGSLLTIYRIAIVSEDFYSSSASA